MSEEKQKADKGIEKIEKEEKGFARILHKAATSLKQRHKRGNWK